MVDVVKKILSEVKIIKPRRYRLKFINDKEGDLMIEQQLKCGCIFGYMSKTNKPIVIFCEKHNK